MDKTLSIQALNEYMKVIVADIKTRIEAAGGTVSEAQIQAAVESYLTTHTIETSAKVGGNAKTSKFVDLSLLPPTTYTVQNSSGSDASTGYIMTDNLISSENVSETTINGITYSITDGKIKIAGTCTAWMSIPLLALPTILIGKLVEVKIFAIEGSLMTNMQCYLASGLNDESGNSIGVWNTQYEKRLRVGSMAQNPTARIAIAEGTTVNATYGCMIRVVDESVDKSDYSFPSTFSNGTRQTFTNGNTAEVIVDGTKPVYVFNSGSTDIKYTSSNVLLENVSQLLNDVGYITRNNMYTKSEKAANLAGKKICFYGDSLTYLQDNLGDSGKWAEQVGAYFGATAYARGKGGANVRMYYQDSASKDTYFDANGKTVGTLAESADGLSHQASFCSWDRIKNSMTQIMFDVIVVMGGTNDFNGNVGEGTLAWSASNTSDVDWVADTEYYNGGDFDISTFKGGLASTIMKLRLVQPQARIVIATLHNGQIRISDTGTATTNRTELPKDTNGKTIIDMANWTKDVADYMGCDFINMVEKIGFSVFNRSGYFVDQVHLTVKGRKNMANGLIGGLECIKAFESV